MTIPEDIRMDENKTCQATIPADLEERIMNPCIAKNEQEWWAQREITRLRAENDRLKSFGLAHELEDARERIAALEADNIEARQRLFEARGQMRTDDSRIKEQDGRIAALEAELKAKQTELEALKQAGVSL